MRLRVIVLWELLFVSQSVLIQIVGVPVACADGVKESWRDLARWAAGRLRNRFADAVQVEYYDLFDPTCPSLPPDAQLPLVLVNGDVLSSGGKLSMPDIRRRVEAILASEHS